jgi:hypothetical protein
MMPSSRILFSLLPNSISDEYDGKKKVFIKLMTVIDINIIAGIGLSNSATREEPTVTPLAIKLQIPIAVALF